jgi:hypothetical protein
MGVCAQIRCAYRATVLKHPLLLRKPPFVSPASCCSRHRGVEKRSQPLLDCWKLLRSHHGWRASCMAWIKQDQEAIGASEHV